MLQVLAELIDNRPSLSRPGSRLDWAELSDSDLLKAMPFWATVDIKRVQASLKNLDLIAVDPNTPNQRSYYYAINEPEIDQELSATPIPEVPVQPAIQQSGTMAGSASFIPPNWQPDKNWLGFCNQHGIPEQFTHSLVPEFIAYWRDAGKSQKSWGNTFFRWTKKKWVEEQGRRKLGEMETTMSANWAPSPDAIEILANGGVSLGFIEDSIPEFILYWRERGAAQGTWNTQFIQHIRRQWTKYSSSLDNDDTPRLIPEGWQPSADCWEVIQLAEIDEEFARTRIPEFTLYWRDSKEIRKSWNSVFLEYLKKGWAKQLKQREGAEIEHAENQTLVGTNQQRVEEKLKRLADRSWAE